MLNTDGVLRAVRVAGSGVLFPIRILTNLVVHLARSGVKLHASSPVTEVDLDRGSVAVAGRVHGADMVVVAAGAWIDRLIPSYKGVAVPSRQAVIFMAPPADLAEAWLRAPVIVVRDSDYGLYALPPRSGTRLKIGDHRFSRIGDADDDRTATTADVESLWRALRRGYHEIDRYAVLEQKACFYTVTEDEAFHVRMVGGRG
jgi:glycine/D-amino acid oxidase-like deaminating enzyme